MNNNTQSQQFEENKKYISNLYIMYNIGVFFTPLMWTAWILTYSKQLKVKDTWLESHIKWLRKITWISFSLLFVICYLILNYIDVINIWIFIIAVTVLPFFMLSLVLKGYEAFKASEEI